MSCFYHATTNDRLPSILVNGLRAGIEKRFADCEDGVYLAGSPELAMMFLIEHLTGTKHPFTSPMDAIAAARVIVVDGALVNRDHLDHDPQVDEKWQAWIYRKHIDITNCPILTVDDIIPQNDSSQLEAWVRGPFR